MIVGRKLSASGIIARALSAHELNRGGSSFSPLWYEFYPQAIEFASIIDQSINEEWPQ
jgi:hypothetical protein